MDKPHLDLEQHLHLQTCLRRDCHDKQDERSPFPKTSCRRRESQVNGCKSGDKKFYQYDCTLSNSYGSIVNNRYVQITPNSVADIWNMNVVDNGTYEFPDWAQQWGIADSAVLSFGFISNSEVQVE